MAKVTGNGTVYFDKTNNKWVGQYIIIEENTKKRKSIHGKTKEEVMRKLAGVHYQYDNGNYIRENGIPLVEILYKNRENKYNANLISDSQYQRLGYVIKSIENSEIGKRNIK